MTSQRVERTWIRTVGSGANGLNDSVIKGLQYTLKNYYEKKTNKKKNMKTSFGNIAANITNKLSVLVFIWQSSNYVSKMSKKTDSEKHLGQSVHECIGLANQ